VVTDVKPVAARGRRDACADQWCELHDGQPVKFGSHDATSFTSNSPNLISAVSPSESAGQIDIVVTTPGGASAISSADHFNFLPTVTGLSPNGGSKAGGTSVTITGTGFAVDTTATVFKFETATATSVNCHLDH